jgi:hypothetical protein
MINRLIIEDPTVLFGESKFLSYQKFEVIFFFKG